MYVPNKIGPRLKQRTFYRMVTLLHVRFILTSRRADANVVISAGQWARHVTLITYHVTPVIVT